MPPSMSDMSQSIGQYFNNHFAEITDPLNRSSGKQVFVAKDKYKAFSDIMASRNKSFNSLYVYKQLASPMYLKGRLKKNKYCDQKRKVKKIKKILASSLLVQTQGG